MPPDNRDEATGMDEYRVQTEIADWLSDTGFTVYWGEAPPDGYRSFTFTGGEVRPDLVAVGTDHRIVVEVKDATDSAGIYDALSQLHGYWREWELNDATVEIEGETAPVSSFVVATQHSPDGHLFTPAREQGWRQTYEQGDGWWNKGMRPQFEYGRTEAIPRIQWRYVWDTMEVQGFSRDDITAGVGVLLSSALDNEPGQLRLGHPSPKVLLYDGENHAHWTAIR